MHEIAKHKCHSLLDLFVYDRQEIVFIFSCKQIHERFRPLGVTPTLPSKGKVDTFANSRYAESKIRGGIGNHG